MNDISEEEKKEGTEKGEKNEKASSGGSSGESIFSLRRFIYIFLGLMALMVMFDRDLRDQMGEALGKVLYPLVGFGGEYPILTLMCVGIIMITFSTLIRDFFIDWVDMAEKQKISNKFRQELMEAKRANKQTKVKKMEKQQEEISKMSMDSFKPQLKSMAITMIVVISIFGWIWQFVGDLPNKTFSVPWALNATLTDPLISGCFMPFPQWIGVYMLISLPFTQVLMVLLKMYDFKKRLKEGET
ncbi:MAG: DUF106 domain-containing protein [Candidatus Natronoplasma sp.]